MQFAHLLLVCVTALLAKEHAVVGSTAPETKPDAEKALKVGQRYVITVQNLYNKENGGFPGCVIVRRGDSEAHKLFIEHRNDTGVTEGSVKMEVSNSSRDSARLFDAKPEQFQAANTDKYEYKVLGSKDECVALQVPDHFFSHSQKDQLDHTINFRRCVILVPTTANLKQSHISCMPDFGHHCTVRGSFPLVNNTLCSETSSDVQN
uniref:Putative secreted protein n=1 Tax=Amblyomma triste TaxID=251400 RepID=A0A023G5D3_AMBTT